MDDDNRQPVVHLLTWYFKFLYNNTTKQTGAGRSGLYMPLRMALTSVTQLH